MSKPSKPETASTLREKLIGLGERSIKKSYYPELKRRRMELELFRSLLDRAQDGVLLAEAESGVVFEVNQTLCELLGLREFDIRGQKLVDVFPASVRGDVKRVLRGAGQEPVEMRISNQGRPVLVLELKFNLQRIADDRYVVALARDITGRKQLEYDLARHVQELTSLNEISLVLNRTDTVQEAVDNALSIAVDHLDADVATIFMRNGEEFELLGLEGRIKDDFRTTGVRIRLGHCLCGLAAKSNSPVISEDVRKDPLCTNANCVQSGLISVISLPLSFSGEVFGVLGVGFVQPYSLKNRMSFFQSLASVVGSGLRSLFLLEERMEKARVLEENVRQLRKTEEALRVNQGRLSELIDNMPGVGMFGRDEKGDFIWSNKEMKEILGYDFSLLGEWSKVFSTLIPDRDYRNRILEQLDSIRDDYLHKEVEITRKDGRERVLSISNISRRVPIPGFHTWGVAVDVTDRTMAQRALETLNRELEALVEDRTRELDRKTRELEEANLELTLQDERKSAFIETVSHDLRTPLTSIQGFAKVIRRDLERLEQVEGGDERKRARLGKRVFGNLTIISQESERLGRLINTYLDLGKIESRQVEWNDTVVEPAELLRYAARSLQGPFFESRRVGILIEPLPELPRVHVDWDRMMQVVSNLLSNAAKFTRPGTTVRLSASLEDQGIVIRFMDKGPGIPPKERIRIFEKFHQVRRGDTLESGHRGSGLGLTITRQIMEHYGGTVLVESSSHRGSTFAVVLPHTVFVADGSGEHPEKSASS